MVRGPAKPKSERLLSPKEIAARFNVTRRTVERWVAWRILPPPIRINARVFRWRESEVEAALNALAALPAR